MTKSLIILTGIVLLVMGAVGLLLVVDSLIIFQAYGGSDLYIFIGNLHIMVIFITIGLAIVGILLLIQGKRDGKNQ